MTTPIAASTSPVAPTAAADNSAVEQKFEMLLGQNMMMRMQASQQAMSKSMTKMTDAIKQSVKDEE